MLYFGTYLVISGSNCLLPPTHFKTGVTINYEGNLYQVLEFQHVKPGKGADIVKAKLRNLRTGSIAEYTFNSGIKVPTAHVEKQKMQFLYATGDSYSFMNMETYEQVELSKSQIENEVKYLKEGIYELRPGRNRILYFHYKSQVFQGLFQSCQHHE